MIQAISTHPEEFLARAHDRLRSGFGFPAFREGQERAIRAIGSGRDLLVIMPTGSGKSLCYQLPALLLPGTTLVVSPLIALMKDQADGLTARGIPATFINSSLGADEQWERLQGLEAGAFKLVYVAPERFRSSGFRAALSRAWVSLLAVDEAHCISEWGHDFRPDYRRLREARALVGPVPAVALTATATPEVQEDIARELELREPERVVTGFNRPNLRLLARKARGRAEKDEELRRFVEEAISRTPASPAPAGIIYAATRRHAEDAAALLESIFPAPAEAGGARRPRCRAYHAGLDPAERREVQEDFMAGRLPWVAATNAFGMGVDKRDVRFVVHYELPGSIEAYYQEVGRAGRDGEPADCLLIFSAADRRLQEFFIEGSNPSRATIEAAYRFLFSLGENPVLRTLVELEDRFRHAGGGESSNPLAFRSALSVLDRAGAIERLDHAENLAEVAPAGPLPWPTNPYPPRATVKHALHEALGRVFARAGGEAANLSLGRWAEELGMDEEALRRGLQALAEDGRIRYLPPFRGRAIRLPERPLALEEAGVDFEALEARRRRDLDRLEELLRFARGRGCRRDVILRHFGETVPPGGCGRCDGCGAGPRRPLGDGDLLVVRKALSGVARARGRCGRKRVIQMLRGSRAEAVAELGLDRLSTFGLLRDHRRSAIEDLLDRLEGAGCIESSGDPFPVLRITQRGVRVMKGEERPEISLPPPVGRRRGVDGSEDAVDGELFERLRVLRRRIAGELGLPAYRVFSDRTLRTMAARRPQSGEELLRVPGVGPVTLERFGARFLELLRS